MSVEWFVDKQLKKKRVLPKPIIKNSINSGRAWRPQSKIGLKLMSKETNASTDNGGIVDYDPIFVRVWNGLSLVLNLFVKLNSGWSPSRL